VKTFASLNRQQREAVGLLQIGTFLEYFDLMLYVHMGVLLNELFFPATDPHTASLITALAFCSTFVLRPFGALIFGYIGDHLGRKHTIIITTMIMAVSCVIMANLPTYAEIGITAAWAVTICRIAQGLSCMGEAVGAQVYITETTKPPAQYLCVSLIGIASVIGGIAALGIASLVTTQGFNWRVAFWIGSIIALVGSAARSRLRETAEFVDAKRRIKNSVEDSRKEGLEKVTELLAKSKKTFHEKTNKKNLFAFFCIYCGWPLCFYMAYVFFNPLLKSKFGYTSEDIIKHNFFLSIVPLVSCSICAYLSSRIHPLKILKVVARLLLLFTLFIPFFIINASNSIQIFLIQAIILAIAIDAIPAESIFISHCSVLSRFTTTSFIYALSRALMYVITSFSLIFIIEIFGYYGLWLIMMPVIVAHLWGVNHFQKLENSYCYNTKR
jgi:MFS family permease